MKLWHVTLISFRDNIPDNIKNEVFDRLLTLGPDCGGIESGIIFWNVGHNLDLRKGVHIVVISAFQNKDALERYKRHVKHGEVTDILSKIADWQVGDMWE